jgi:hypothetical protein
VPLSCLQPGEQFLGNGQQGVSIGGDPSLGGGLFSLEVNGGPNRRYAATKDLLGDGTLLRGKRFEDLAAVPVARAESPGLWSGGGGWSLLWATRAPGLGRDRPASPALLARAGNAPGASLSFGRPVGTSPAFSDRARSGPRPPLISRAAGPCPPGVLPPARRGGAVRPAPPGGDQAGSDRWSFWSQGRREV